MKNMKGLVTRSLTCAGALVLGQGGCQWLAAPEPDALAAPGALAQPEGADQTVAERGTAELWAVTCSRCHNSRSPGSYSDAEWDVAMLHMKIQAYLSNDEYERILNFLKASN